MHPRLRGTRAVAAALIAAVALATIAVAPAAAVRFGTDDGNDHPYVGLMVAQDSTGNPLWRCTGTLLSDRIFLTAGHCVQAPAAHIEIWFSAGPEPVGAGYPAANDNRCAGVTGYPCTGDVGGTPHSHPQWDPNQFWTHDLGVVELDADMPMSTYGTLPSLNSLDALHTGRSTTFTAVGYGLQLAFPDPAAWKDEAVRVRKVAHPWLIQNNTPFSGDIDLIVTDNAAGGGTCFGDSGGPNFVGDTTTIAGVNSFVYNSQCAGFSGVYRIDKPDDVDWLATFLS
jgi:Trypsin